MGFHLNNRMKDKGLVQVMGGIAQLVEQQTVMQQVLGSIPTQTQLGVDSAFHPSVGR